jgi:hypothetical protein
MHSFAKSSDFDDFTIEGWFGYGPEITRETWSQEIAFQASKKIQRNLPIKRMLLVDSFSAHKDPQFIWYYIMFDIIPY